MIGIGVFLLSGFNFFCYCHYPLLTNIFFPNFRLSSEWVFFSLKWSMISYLLTFTDSYCSAIHISVRCCINIVVFLFMYSYFLSPLIHNQILFYKEKHLVVTKAANSAKFVFISFGSVSFSMASPLKSQYTLFTGMF